jgi:hypothetical protein
MILFYELVLSRHSVCLLYAYYDSYTVVCILLVV